MISFSEENTELWKKLFANEATKKHEYNSTGKILFYSTILMKEITSLIVTDKIVSTSGISSSKYLKLVTLGEYYLSAIDLSMYSEYSTLNQLGKK